MGCMPSFRVSSPIQVNTVLSTAQMGEFSVDLELDLNGYVIQCADDALS